jgi:putative peptidoglycan lipid II flippase
MTQKEPSSHKGLSSRTNSYIVSFCILLSRMFGLIREILLAHFLGTSIYSDAFKAALRIPNVLQNLFGEGVLSASFIPVYVRLRKDKEYDKASTLAKETGVLLLTSGVILSSAGIIFSDTLVHLLAPGFSDETFSITSDLLTLLFPATAILMLSAWCLGILNSHKYFALSYSAPVFWNISIIFGLGLLTLPFFDSYTMKDKVLHISYFVLFGSLLQFLVQLPKTLSLIKGTFSFRPASISTPTKEVLRGFLPVSLGRGVVQISAYIDTIIASLLSSGSLSILMYAQSVFLLPVSVFGMAVSAAELPDLSEEKESMKDPATREKFIVRLQEAKGRLLFFIFPCVMLFLSTGASVITFIFKSGKFDQGSVMLVSYMLAVLAFGLVPSTLSRLLSSGLYALSYHTLVSKISVCRLLFGSILGASISLLFMPITPLPEEFHVLGLGAGSVAGAWAELYILHRILNKKTGIPSELIGPKKLLIPTAMASLLASIPAFLLQITSIDQGRLISALPVISYTIIYLVLCRVLKVKNLITWSFHWYNG